MTQETETMAGRGITVAAERIRIRMMTTEIATKATGSAQQ
jgi:hypothetical protein